MASTPTFNVLYIGKYPTDRDLFDGYQVTVYGSENPNKIIRLLMRTVFDGIIIQKGYRHFNSLSQLIHKIIPWLDIYVTDSFKQTDEEEFFSKLEKKQFFPDGTSRELSINVDLFRQLARVPSILLTVVDPVDVVRALAERLGNTFSQFTCVAQETAPMFISKLYQPNSQCDKAPEKIQELGNLIFRQIVKMEKVEINALNENVDFEQLALLLPFFDEKECIGVVMLFEKEEISEEEKRFFHLAFAHLYNAVVGFEHHHYSLIRDGLSNLYNHNYLYYRLHKYWKQTQHAGSSLGLMIIDIDKFKAINDTYGHRMGDFVLHELGELLLQLLDPTFLLARYGGDEFAIIAPDSNPEELMFFAQKLLETIRNHSFKGVKKRDDNIRITISIGTACSSELGIDNEITLLDMADEAMYIAKNNGRDQVRSGIEIIQNEIKKESTATLAKPKELKGSVMVVDDDPMIVMLLKQLLEQLEYNVTTASDAYDALEVIRSDPNAIDLVLTDVEMPGISGFELVQAIKNIDPNIVISLVTGNASSENAIEALKIGVFNFLTKPFNRDEIEVVVMRGIERRRFQKQLDAYHHNLEDILQERTATLYQTMEKLKKSYVETMKTIVAIQDAHEDSTAAHSRRVSELALLLAKEMGITDQQLLTTIHHGALLHDIGKIGIPDAILLKPGRLTDDEMEIMKTHVEMGWKIVLTIPTLEKAAEMVYSHHERWDGKGYPRQLIAEEIFIGARIFMVVDTFDAIFFDRLYSKGRELSEAVNEINACSGTQFDPKVVEAFNKCYKKIAKRSLEIQ